MALRSLTLDDKALRKARLDDWCARNRVETQPPPRDYELTPAEILALGVGKRVMIYGRRKLQVADVARAKAGKPPRATP